MKWEYRVETLNPRASDDWATQLTKHGADGWELVSTVSAGANFVTVFLKRTARS